MFERATSAAAEGGAVVYPIDFGSWPRGARWLWKTLTALPSWHEAGWASPSDENLRHKREVGDRRPIQRARRDLVARGEVEYRQVRRGEALPGGGKARGRFWIYTEGPAMRARRLGIAAAADGAKFAPNAVLNGTRSVPIWSVDLVDPDRSKEVRSSSPAASPPVTPHAPAADPTSSFGEESTRTERGGDPEPLVLASAVAQHFVTATGARWRTIRSDVLGFIAPFLADMDGDASSRVERACRVIDQVVRESTKAGARPPTLRYVFHAQMFWKRLARLDDPTAPPLRPDARAAEGTPPPPPKPPAQPAAVVSRSNETTADEAADFARARADLEAQGFTQPPAPQPVQAPAVALDAPPSAPAHSSDPEVPPTSDRSLDALGRRAVPWAEAPECHDPSCGDCERCAKRAPLSGVLFGELREQARGRGKRALVVFGEPLDRSIDARRTAGLVLRDELRELRDRDIAVRRTTQRAALEEMQHQGAERTGPSIGRARRPAAPVEGDDLALLRHAEHEARVRRGLPPPVVVAA